jgi:hypothetical protein
VNFSFEKYASQSLRQKNLSPALRGVRGIGNENRAYRNALLNIYKECVENMMQKKYENFKPQDLLKDFENLMDGYRDYCRDKGKRAPESHGGWKKSEAIEAMNETLRIMDPKDKVDYAERKYWARELRIRDMRKFVQDNPGLARGQGTKEQVAILEIYRTALLKAIETRSQGWGKFNLLRARLEKKTCNILGAFISANSQHAVEADDIVDENVVPKAEGALKESADAIKEMEKSENKEMVQGAEQKQNNERMKMNLDFMSEKVNNKDMSPKIEENNASVKNSVIQN